MSTIAPSVIVKEVDESSYVETVSVSQAGYVGTMNWGPANYPTIVNSTDILATLFGKPTTNAQSWYTAKGYLDYSDNLMLVRSIGTGSMNATDRTFRDLEATVDNIEGNFITSEEIETSDGKSAIVVSFIGDKLKFYNESNQLTTSTTVTGKTSGATATIQLVDKSYFSFTTIETPVFNKDEIITGQLSNASASVIDIRGNKVIYQLTSDNDFQFNEIVIGTASQSIVASIDGVYHYYKSGILIENEDKYNLMTTKPFIFAARYPGELGNSIKVEYCDNTTFANWEYASLFDMAPESGEYHIVIIDTDGVFYNSYAGNVLESYAFVSKNPDSIDINGQSNFYKTIINNQSSYIYCGDKDFEELDYNNQLMGGLSVNPEDADIITSYETFTQPNASDTFYLFGDYNTTIANSVIALCEKTQTLHAVFSPTKDVVFQGSETAIVNSIVQWSNQITKSNRVFLDSNWRQVLNTFNNTYVWVPCCSATTGLTSRTDTNYDVHMSPMGRNRGIYVNTTKLAWEPSKSAQGAIYAVSVNPIVTQGTFGVLLWGDRTHIMRASRMRQWGVRRMLTTIEIAMSYFLGFAIGENNNAQTRALYKSQLDQFLRERRAQGWFMNYEVILDETNNTEQVINEQKMRVLVRVLPQSSINWVELTMTVVNSVTQFTEGGAI